MLPQPFLPLDKNFCRHGAAGTSAGRHANDLGRWRESAPSRSSLALYWFSNWCGCQAVTAVESFGVPAPSSLAAWERPAAGVTEPQEGQGRFLALEIIDIRHFEARAFQPLLQVESRHWDNNLRWDYAPSSDLITACLEEKRLSGYALVKEARICGYSFFFYEGDKGLIGNLFVEPDDDLGLEQARLLLDHVLETMLATPGIRRIETQLPHYSFEDLNPSFRGHQFTGYARRFMAAPLDPWSAASGLPVARTPRSLPADFVMVPWERKHDHEAAQLLYLTYRNHVDATINDQYGSAAGSERLIDNIVRHRGCGEHLPRVSLVAIHQPSRKLAGVLAITSVRPGTAHIPQVAVGREFQGCGLGTAMMEPAFRDLAGRGFREVSLTVTESNSGAVRLYERLGFETFRTFGAFAWNR
jgi:ribosomal protein S18 acetylase RimI-like enzyme